MIIYIPNYYRKTRGMKLLPCSVDNAEVKEANHAFGNTGLFLLATLLKKRKRTNCSIFVSFVSITLP